MHNELITNLIFFHLMQIQIPNNVNNKDFQVKEKPIVELDLKPYRKIMAGDIWRNKEKKVRNRFISEAF
jgi:hypothetical protein